MNKLHDDHNRLSLSSNADELDDVYVAVLLENTALLQELLLCIIRQSLSTCFDRYFQVCRFIVAAKHISKVTLATIKTHQLGTENTIQTQRQQPRHGNDKRRMYIKCLSMKSESPHNAMQCNAMQCNAMQCNAMQCNAMQCNTIQKQL